MIPPASPYSLIQEHVWPNRWLVIVTSMMLNCTRRKQVEKVLPDFVQLWPDPETFVKADDADVIDLIRPLGFANRRTVNLKSMSKRFITKDWFDARELPGVGAYAAAAYEIFCLGKVPAKAPDDHALKQYVFWFNEVVRSGHRTIEVRNQNA